MSHKATSPYYYGSIVLLKAGLRWGFVRPEGTAGDADVWFGGWVTNRDLPTMKIGDRVRYNTKPDPKKRSNVFVRKMWPAPQREKTDEPSHEASETGPQENRCAHSRSRSREDRQREHIETIAGADDT